MEDCNGELQSWRQCKEIFSLNGIKHIEKSEIMTIIYQLLLSDKWSPMANYFPLPINLPSSLCSSPWCILTAKCVCTHQLQLADEKRQGTQYISLRVGQISTYPSISSSEFRCVRWDHPQNINKINDESKHCLQESIIPQTIDMWLKGGVHPKMNYETSIAVYHSKIHMLFISVASWLNRFYDKLI